LLKYFGALKSLFRPGANPHKAGYGRRLFPFSFGITVEGVIFILSVFVLSLAAVNTGNNLLFVILAVLFSSIVVSGIISRNSLRHLSLSLQLPENVFVCEQVSIKVTLRNLKKFFPSFSIRVEDPDLRRKRASQSLRSRLWKRLSFGRGNHRGSAPSDRAMFRRAAYFPILRPGEICSELMMQSFPNRGLYSLQGFWISTRFPFGLFRRGEFIGAKGEILVYPLTQEISSFFHLLPFLPGHLEAPNVGPGENLFSIRKYQQSESARIIDWKATAKTGDLMAREFAREEESKLCLILDTEIPHKPPEESEESFEKAVSLAASLAAHFLKEGAGMEFLTQQEYVPRGTGIEHLYRILRSLAVVQCRSAVSGAGHDSWDTDSFAVVQDKSALRQIFSDKVFKIIISSKPRGSFPSALWRSSHVVFFDEL
jgi:uncharacterized protein (DUF58 family)